MKNYREFKELVRSDRERDHGGSTRYTYRLLWWLRFASCMRKGSFYYKLTKKIYSSIADKHGIEIDPSISIGKGFCLGHVYNITVNPNAVLGENITLQKGVTIGQENRGKRKGATVLGKNIWVGVNASIIGHIRIGNNVLIAPNSFVNCDVPDNSIVFGNPCIIKSNPDATKGYIDMHDI